MNGFLTEKEMAALFVKYRCTSKYTGRQMSLKSATVME